MVPFESVNIPSPSFGGRFPGGELFPAEMPALMPLVSADPPGEDRWEGGPPFPFLAFGDDDDEGEDIDEEDNFDDMEDDFEDEFEDDDFEDEDYDEEEDEDEEYDEYGEDEDYDDFDE